MKNGELNWLAFYSGYLVGYLRELGADTEEIEKRAREHFANLDRRPPSHPTSEEIPATADPVGFPDEQVR